MTTGLAVTRPDSVDAPAERPGRGPTVVVLLAVFVGLAVRIGFLLTREGWIDGDEAVTGIMAHRMAKLDAFYVFFAGQPYNGAFEQYLQASLFRIGLPENAFTLRLPELALAGLSCWLVYVVGIRLLRTRWHAALASLLFALGPYFLIWNGVRSIGGYVIEIVVILVAILCAIDADREVDAGRQRRLVFAFGFCFGITYWFTLSGYFVLVPVALWIAPHLIRSRRSLVTTGVGVVVGLAPIIGWMIVHGSVPRPNPYTPSTTALERFGNLTDPVGREFLGVAYLYGDPGWPVALGRLLVAGVLVVAVVALVAHRQSLMRLVRLQPDGRQPFDVVLLAVPLAVLTFIASSYAWFTKEPRYLLCMYPVLVLGLAALPPRRRVSGLVTAGLLVVLVAAPSLTLLVTRADDAPANRDRDLRRAIAMLRADGTTHVYAAYWTAMPLQFIAGDRLTVGAVNTALRFPEYRRAVDASPAPAWVASRNSNRDDVRTMRQALMDAGLAFRERRVGGVSVFDRFSSPIRPWEVGLGSPFP